MGYWSEVDILMRAQAAEDAQYGGDPFDTAFATITTDIAPWWAYYADAVTVEVAA